MSLKSTLILLVILCSGQLSNAQEATPDPAKVKQQIPTSPEASALGKFGDIPVGLYTGVPNISVPIYTLKIKDFELPIALSYNSSGIKVEEMATNNGLGWSLNPGGSLAVSVNGLPDDDYGGFLYPQLGDDILPPVVLTPGTVAYDYNQNGGGQLYQWAKRAADGIIDTQPDLFYYSIPGASGKFYFDQDKQIHPVPFTAIKIVKTDGPLGGYTITDESGRIYKFRAGESSIMENSCGLPIINSSAFLSSIQLPDGNMITLNYTPVEYSYEVQPPVSRQKLVANNYAPAFLDCVNRLNHTVKMSGVRLSGITSTAGHDIKFIYHNNRKDLPGTQSLDSIKISNQNGIINSYAFNYGYFGGSVNSPDYSRLKLLSINSLTGAKHTFSYNETIAIPPRLSFSQDHWGYFNGKPNSMMLPFEPDYGFVVGANREVDSTFSQMAILKQITYPTGGYTRFNYEQNDYFFKGTEKTYIPNSYMVTGRDNETVSTSFTIPADQTVIYGDVSYNDGTPPPKGPLLGDPPADAPTRIDISGNGISESYYNGMTQNGKIGITLTPGTYTISIACDAAAKGAYCSVSYLTSISTYVEKNKPIGGLRIKSIISKADAGANSVIKQYVYRQAANPQMSSGAVNFYPRYTIRSERFYYTKRDNTSDPGVCRDQYSRANYASFWKQMANSVYPIGSIKGGSVGYTYVTELNGVNGENGKTESEFSFSPSSGGSLSAPLIPFIDHDWLNGLLKKEIKYVNQGGVFKPLTKAQNFYSIQPESVFWNSHYKPSTYLPQSILRGRGVNIQYKRDEKLCALTIYPAEFFINDFNFQSEWVRLDSSSTVNYYYRQPPLSTDSVRKSSQMVYNNPAHLMANITKTKVSDGTLIQSINTFPQDYPRNTSPAIDSLTDRHRINTVLQQQINNNTQVQTTKYIFKNWDNKTTEPEYVQTQTGTATLENRLQFYNYDDRSNPLSNSQVLGAKTNCLWSYNKMYPIAEIKNAEYPAIVTALGGAAAIDVFAKKPAPSKAEIDAFLAPIRNNAAFAEAQLTTYTYDPLVGILTATDGTGKITTYEYDTSKRLKNIKDQNGNIVKNINYNYKP